MSARRDLGAEEIRRKYAATVSLLRCPHHHKNAWVDIIAEEASASHIDVVTCCQEFEQRVRKLLTDSA